LPDILQDRLHQSPSHTQVLTSILLSLNALVSIAIAPFTGHLADGSKSKNQWMVLSWVTNAVGAVITAWSTTLVGLFIGRLIQTFAGSVIWIVGMAILGDTVGAKDLAKALGFAMLFVSAGLLCGPAVSGSLYQFVSYSMTWASVFAVLLLGLVLQLLIIGPFNYDMTAMRNATNQSSVSDMEDTLVRRPFLGSESTPSGAPYQSVQEYTSLPPQPQDAQASTHNVYWMMLRKKRVCTALVADILFAIVIASFETTIPIHINAVFHWESLQAGLLFLLLQAPSLVLVVPAGWLKDRIGMRYPVTIGFLCLAPSLWLLGVPGQKQFPWARDDDTNRAIFIITLLGIGVWRTLLLGFGAVEVLHGANELAAQSPGVFGPHGGYSRSFSMSNISWKLGMFVQPLLSGTLTEQMGYYEMNLVLGIPRVFDYQLSPPPSLALPSHPVPCMRPLSIDMSQPQPQSQVIALAGGTGDLGHYLQEELGNNPRYSVVILTRQSNPPTPQTANTTIHSTDYSLPSLLSILTSTNSTTLISLLRCPDPDYVPLHTTLLAACRLSPACKRFIPSEWAGDIEAYPDLPRAYRRTRAPFRALLAQTQGVEWTLFNHGWCMEYFLPETRSFRRCMPGEFPIDLGAWRYTVRGTGEEMQSWTCARDIARAVVRLLGVKAWVSSGRLIGGLGRSFERAYRSKANIEDDIKKYEDQPDSLELAIAEAEEWTISGATACPKEKTLQQREKFFSDIQFTTVGELLKKAEVEGRV
ncbi:MFS general substrate transporter, partial [Aspergillus homomorphus CBS 101889]